MKSIAYILCEVSYFLVFSPVEVYEASRSIETRRRVVTCIIGVRDRKSEKIYIGGDRLKTIAGTSDFHAKNRKVWVGGQSVRWVIGHAGMNVVGQILQYRSEPLPEPSGEGDLVSFLFNEWRPIVRDAVNNAGLMEKDKDGGERVPSNFLLGIRNRLFFIDPTLAICEAGDDFLAIGEGKLAGLAVMGAIERLAPEMDTEERLKLALEQAERFCRGVGRPFDIEHT